MIDVGLLAPGGSLPGELTARLPAQDSTRLAERVCRRAALLSRRDRSAAESILAARDALVLALYARATPRGTFTTWSDGSSKMTPQELIAGIGGLLMDPQGRIVSRLSRPCRGLDAFAAEIAALEAVQHSAAVLGAERLRVYTDCVALLHLWLESRADARLEKVREQARRFRRFELRALPRAHNQPANRLARQALAQATSQGLLYSE